VVMTGIKVNLLHALLVIIYMKMKQKLTFYLGHLKTEFLVLVQKFSIVKVNYSFEF